MPDEAKTKWERNPDYKPTVPSPEPSDPEPTEPAEE